MLRTLSSPRFYLLSPVFDHRSCVSAAGADRSPAQRSAEAAPRVSYVPRAGHPSVTRVWERGGVMDPVPCFYPSTRVARPPETIRLDPDTWRRHLLWDGLRRDPAECRARRARDVPPTRRAGACAPDLPYEAAAVVLSTAPVGTTPAVA